MIAPDLEHNATCALVTGADRPFGRAVAARLREDGISVVTDLAAIPDGATLALLVLDLTMPSVDTPFRAVTDDDCRTVLDGQLYALVDAVQTAVLRMTNGGAIVQIIPNAFLGAWGGVHVAASAAACVAMARSMAIELAPRGIRVNSVATGRPGPAGDTVQVCADVAATAAWLGGGDSARITGDTIMADRGASLQMAQAMRP